MRTVTVIPSDNIVVVDGSPLNIKVDLPSNVHAIQWSGTAGHIEYSDMPNKNLSMTDFLSTIEPIVLKYENEKKRLAEEHAKIERDNLPNYIRSIRNSLLTDCDYLLVEDYPISDSTKKQWEEYRRALRNITELPGFPWKSINDVPWPTKPTAIH